jgi:hypothetical protein
MLPSKTVLLLLAALLHLALPSPPLDAASGRSLLRSLPVLEYRVGNLTSAASLGSVPALSALPSALEALADAQGALRRHGAAAASRAAALRAMLRASGGSASVGALVLSYAAQAKDLQGALRFGEALAMVRRARDAGARGGGLPPAAVASLDSAESEILDCVGDAAGALAAYERAGGGGDGGGALLYLVDLLRKAAADAPPGPAVEALRAREGAAVAKLLAAGPWEHPRQLPKTYVRGLFSAPWHEHSGSGARWRALTEPVAAALEAARGELAAEFFALQRAGRLLEETECVHVGGAEGGGGTWRWFATNGFWEEADGDGCATAAPRACALLVRLRAAAPALRVLRAGYSAIEGRVHLRPHCGWTNAQLKMHLGLVVPRAGAGQRRKRKGGGAQRGEPCARLRVGNETRAWEGGKVLFFDDSWEHEVTHACDDVRVVFQLVFAHPDTQLVSGPFEGAQV